MPNLSLQLDWTENCVLVYTKAVSFSTQSCFFLRSSTEHKTCMSIHQCTQDSQSIFTDRDVTITNWSLFQVDMGGLVVEWLETWHSSSSRHYVEAYWFQALRSRVRITVRVRVRESALIYISRVHISSSYYDCYYCCCYAPAPNRRGIKRWCCLTSVCLSRTSGLSREQRGHRKTKIGIEVVHVTRESDTTFRVKRSKVKVTRPLYSPPC